MKAAQSTSMWDDLLRILPGYDPFIDSEGYYFDEEAALRVIGFAETLTHIKGELAGVKLVLEKWQKGYLANLFGWKKGDPDNPQKDDPRRYTESLLFIPRKNGKSFLASCICLYMFFCDGELGAEIVCAAFEQNQARLVWDVCRHQINANPDLKGACKTFQHSIVIDTIASTLKPISAESRSAHGFNLHCAVMDELHVQRDDELVVALQTSMGSRRQPLMIHITTSDYERESICNKIYDYAKQVMDPKSNVVDPTFLPGIYEASITDDWTIEETWKKANPNYGVSVRPEYLQKMCEKAKNDPSFENEFKRLHLNIRTEQSVRYLQMADWDKCSGVVEKESLLGRTCFGGLDLSINEDLSAFVLVFPNDDGGYDILPKFYSPRERALQRKKKYGVDYAAWAKQGFITLTEGDIIDYDFIMEDIRKASEMYNLKDVGYDKWNAEHFRQTVEAEGICRMVEFPQNFSSMNEPMKTMVSLLREGKINHGGHPVLRWNASNLMAKTDPNGRVRPIKQKVEQKIDGIVSMIIGIGRAMFGDVVQASVYESGNGILEL